MTDSRQELRTIEAVEAQVSQVKADIAEMRFEHRLQLDPLILKMRALQRRKSRMIMSENEAVFAAE